MVKHGHVSQLVKKAKYIGRLNDQYHVKCHPKKGRGKREDRAINELVLDSHVDLHYMLLS